MSRYHKDPVLSEINETFVAGGIPSKLRESASKMNRSILRSSTLRPDLDKTLLIGDLGNNIGLTSDKTMWEQMTENTEEAADSSSKKQFHSVIEQEETLVNIRMEKESSKSEFAVEKSL